jgi:hypothetical protein
MNDHELENDDFRIDAIEMSLRLRIETGKKLAKLTRAERCKLLNQFTKNDPILNQFPHLVTQLKS